MKQILIIIFILIITLELTAVKLNIGKLRLFTKPLLMPLLAGIYITAAPHINYIIITALFFSFLGDISLLGPDRRPVFFTVGLSFFLAGHISYITAFLESVKWLEGMPLYYNLMLAPYLAGLWVFHKKLGPAFGRMRLPVLIYACTIILMSFFAAARWHSLSGPAFWLPFAGSISFILSDFLIAYNMFVKKMGGSSVQIMSFYIIAQVLIILGFTY